MKYPYTLPLSAALISGMAALPANAELTVTPYSSLRIQTEAVSVGEAQPGEDDSYTGLRRLFAARRQRQL